jgi:hypothetical protein
MGIWNNITNFPGFTFVKNHEKLVIIIVLCLVGLHFWSTGLNMWERHDQKRVADLAAQDAANKANTAQALQQGAADKAAAALDKAATMQLVATVTAQNAALSAAMLARDKVTQNQQKADLQATLPVLGQRLVVLVPNVNPADIRVAPDQKTVTIGVDTVQKTVAQLELIPGLQADLKDSQQQVVNLTSEITSLQTYNRALETEVATQDRTIALLQKEIAGADKLCKAEVDLEKVKTKKAFMHGLKIGVILGFFGGVFGAHAAGI